MVAGLFSPETFWFYMVMKNGDQEVQVPLPEDLKAEAVQRVIDSALKRFSTGFLKTVAVWAPVSTPPMSPYAPREQKRQFRRLRQYLGEDFNVIDTDLKKGMVPETADILLLLAPESLNDKQLFGVDQFLMQGGSVIMATSFSDIEMNGALKVRKVDSGLEKWLEHNGITVEKELVFDPQNTPFPVPRKRNLGGFVVQETQLVNYPLFVDIRPDGMDRDSGLLAGIRQLTMSWASPVTVDGKKNGQRKINKLLFSSPDSWRSDNLNIQPDFDRYGELGFKAGETRGRAALAVMVEGGFTSWFKDKPSPLAAGKKEKKKAGKQGDKSKDKKEEPLVINRVIDHSPDSSRLFVFGSNTFLSDIALGLSSSVNGAIYDAPLQLVANCIDWSLEDRELLSMRSHTRFSRTLLPLQTGERRVIEYLNYGLALAGLVLIWIVGLWLRRRTRLRFQAILDDSGRV
jgi:ABC-2 type transport system permease protein